MCGILGVMAKRGGTPSVSDGHATRMRDEMLHRGPDAGGLWRHENVVLAHRRLSIIDPSPAGAQPMCTPDARLAIVYNGELYNDAELRRELAEQAVSFRSTSDTETLLLALRQWGAGTLERLRGMYAFGLVDTVSGDLLLARDPIGIKPLYWARVQTPTGPELVFASEIPAILAHPHMPARPDWAVVNSYLTTIRVTLGERTMYEGVRLLQPGEAVVVSGTDLAVRRIRDAWRLPLMSGQQDLDGVDQPEEHTRIVVSESVRGHLRSDVALCTLLSGGLDSSIIASVARQALPELWSYCAGCKGEDAAASDDFPFAAEVAGVLGTRHREAPITRDIFLERWGWLVSNSGVPLSTPNEVAIHEVASRLRADGQIVTLSGEGADEYFGGYELPLRQAAAFEEALDEEHSAEQRALARASYMIDANAWVPRAALANILSKDALRLTDGGSALTQTYAEACAACEEEAGHSDPLHVHLLMMQRVNLQGLLLRLDAATMRASVEGRTPLADVEVARLANGLPMAWKFRADEDLHSPSRSERGRTGAALKSGATRNGTKIVLRRAFADYLPASVVERPKASFPLPFQHWLAEAGGLLSASAFAREVFSTQAISAVSAHPEAHWTAAWPMINLAMWGERFTAG